MIFINQANDCDEICREQNYSQIPDDKEERTRLLSEANETFGPILKEYQDKILETEWVTNTSYSIGINMRNDGVFETEFEYSNELFLVFEELEIISPYLDHPNAGKITVVEKRVFPEFLSFAIVIVGISGFVAYREARK
ncbi:MAG: hypothetical protein HZA82_03840 [Thaumarchaeota archaeon]|nr:hypothetical protein [Nitrososphaerota archaeon]